MKSTKRLLYSAAVGAGLIFCGGAQAEDWKVTGEFGFTGVGKAQEMEKGHSYWVGEFTGTFFNDKGENSLFHRAGVKCPSWFDTDLNNKKSKAGGYCIITDLNGGQAYLTWQGAGTPGPGGRLPGTFQYTDSTGKYQGISGDNTFVGVTQVNWKDGTSSGYATWNR
jgi:hypothetical protein